MQKSFFLSVLLALIINTTLFGQCSTTSYSMPDSICSGLPFQLVNTSTPGNTFQWDMCPGDLSTIPFGQNLGNVGPLSFPQQIRAVTSNGKYFVFVASYLGNTLLRLDFGTSFNNTPVPYSYGSYSGLLNQPTGLDVMNDNGIWYALMTNSTNKKVTRINLGATIDANISSATDLGLFNLNNPKNLKIAKDGANYYAFVTNELSTDLIRIDFGNSLANVPSGFTAITDPLFISGWGFDVTFDCSLNKYIGFFVSYTQNKVHILDFGNSLLNTPTISQTVNSAINPSGAQLIRDGVNWHLMLSVFGMSQLQNFKIGNNLLNTPVSIFADTVAGIKSPQSITVLKDSSHYFAFSANTSPASLSRINWMNPCAVTPSYSTDTAGVSVVSTGGGYQNISLTSTNSIGLMNTYVDSIFINPSPTTYFTASSGCDGLPIQFSDSSVIGSGSIATWSWDFGDGSPLVGTQNPSYLYASTGSYNVTLTASSAAGCTNSFSDSVTVSPLPQAGFGFANNQCSGVGVNFNDLSVAISGATLINWTWNFGDGTPIDFNQNPVHTFDSTGTYFVNLTVAASTGCIDSIAQSITILPSPVTEFTVSSTCLGETASFTNNTTIQGGGTLNYNWDFGDSGNSTLTNPTHQYVALAGNYDVTLVAIAANGCSDTTAQNIRISNKPVPMFTWIPNIACQGNQVIFNSTSSGTGGDTISAYLWDFGDLSSSSLENPTHVYADSGSYNVTLTVVSPTQCDSSITQQVYVISSPTASFTATQVCLNVTTSFNPLISTPIGTAVDSIVWTFGDGGSFSGLSSPTHDYMAPGRYEVIMTVYNNLLCTGTYIDSVNVYPIPVANFTTTNSCSGSITGFDGTSSSVVGDTLSGWLWNFDGLGSATDTIAQFNFATAGIYNVTLITTSIHGCADTIQQPVSVIQSPDFDFTYNEPCFGIAANFVYTSNVTPIPPSNLQWNFGDGNLSFLLAPSHVYTFVDTFNVVLTVENPTTLCSASKSKQLIVKPLPNAGFIANDICEDLPLQFTDTTSITSGSITTWNWNLGIFGVSNVPNPLITPTLPGLYPVMLSVTSDQGCSSAVNKIFTVFAKPDAAFTPDPLYGSPPLTVNFINNTTGALTYNWEFGDGMIATLGSPTHIYSDTGLFAITMIATSAEGCLDTANSVISVLIPNLDIGVRKIYATQNGTSVRLTAELVNAGNVNVTEFTIEGVIENNSTISEHWNGDFGPGSVMLYTFNSSYEVANTFSPAYFCVEVLNPNESIDVNPSNNKRCEVINNEFELFSAYPNPFDQNLNLNFNLNTDGPFNFELYDATGKIILKEENLAGLKGFNTYIINTVTVSKGSYACVIRFRDETKMIKVVKLK